MGKTANATACRVCSGAIQATGKDRPPAYCSAGCRRAAEYEIRRCNDTITKLEDQARGLRNPAMPHLPSHEAQLEFLAAEIADARKRLRKLLVD